MSTFLTPTVAGDNLPAGHDTVGQASRDDVTRISSTATFPMYRESAGASDMYLAVDIRREESNDAYHEPDGYRSCSPVKTFLDSPRLYHSRYVTKSIPPLSSAALDHGRLLHEWFEFGDIVREKIAVPPEATLTSTGLVGKEARQWAADNAPPGAVILAPKEAQQFELEVAALESEPAVAELRSQITDRELSIRWTTPEGDRLKCRADAVTPEFFLDLKTTRCQDILSEFYDSVLRFKYHLQDAWYQRGMEALGMEARPLRFIAISTVPPHDCQVVTLPEPVIAEGRRLMDRALADLRLRESLDWWLPDQHGEVKELPFPAHVLRRFS